MNRIQLLDCTLRDGGYINDWEFGHDHLISIFERIVDAGVDIIEIGFLDERRITDLDRSIMPGTDPVRQIYGGMDRKNTMVVGMIDYGTCGLDLIRPAAESWLDGIRVIFKKHLRREAMAYCEALKQKGYCVFAQLVSVTSYEDEEMLDLIRLANQVRPYAVSMVDTYGLMHQNNLLHYFELLDAHLDPLIGIGYHGHNNFQMGYANAIEFLKRGKTSGRDLVIDGTLYGCGKGAGNAPVELLAMHLNAAYGKKYKISQLLEAIDVSIAPLTPQPAWGYDLKHFIAAFNDCHPNYVSYLLNKRTLSVHSVNEILQKLEGGQKLLYKEAYIEKLYYEYLAVSVNDEESIRRLKKKTEGREILLLGPGNSIRLQKDRIQAFMIEKDPLVISVNFIPVEPAADCLFLSNAKRYVQQAAVLSGKRDLEVIATSNVAKTSGDFSYQLSFPYLLCGEAEFRDNPMLMLLKVMIRLKHKRVYMAGFDGYAGAFHTNYVDQKMEYHYSDLESQEINRAVSAALRKLRADIETVFLTDTLYDI